MITSFGSYQGSPVDCIRLEAKGISCEILSYGATLRRLTVPDREGKPRDVVLGFDRVEDYVNHNCYFGAVIGPNANRIAGASCPFGTGRLKLGANDGPNNLHSGNAGMDRKLWELLAASEEAVTLLYTHPHGLGGFPGNLTVAVTYWLEESSLLVEYRAVSERNTLCNPTNHSYFNLEGHDSGDILDHRIQLRAGSFTPTDARSIPTGAIRAVSGGEMDLTQPVRIGDRIDGPEEQLQLAGGFDHSYVLDAGEEALRPAAKLWAPHSGITLELWTDRPALQFYTGNYIPEGLAGKDGAVYRRRQGLCLETQAFPDALNHSSFPSTVLKAGKEWQSRSVFRFGIE